MMELENIVANTVYIKAKESGGNKNHGRSKHWRDMLKFPHVSECLHIKEDMTDKSYRYLVDSQPIGKQLFWQFCRTNEKWAVAVEFVIQAHAFAVCLPDQRSDLAQSIIDTFFPSPYFTDKLLHIMHKEDQEIFLKEYKLLDTIIPKDLFSPIKTTVITFLSDEPLKTFIDSVYFLRYLQWKMLERTTITKKTFRMYRVLGKGGFGEVCACQSKASGKLYACKKLEKKRIKKRKGESMALNEKNILQKVNSRFIVNLVYTFETKEALCLVLTIMNGGDLKFHIHNMCQTPGFEEDRARFYAAEITLGLQHLHKMNIIYRDLKPENILIDDIGHLRISDLGLAIEIDPNNAVRGRVGTVGYMAPEVIKNEKYTYGPDWFGLGCIVYEMINGNAPFRKRRERVKREEVERRVREDDVDFNDVFSHNAKTFCLDLLQKNPVDRLGCSGGAKSVKCHVWFHDVVNWTRMDEGIEDVPFTPDPHAVYAKDVLDIEQFSTVKGVKIDDGDQDFYKKFCTGAVSIPWQTEMIETECFSELNVIFKDNSTDVVDNLNKNLPPPPPKKGFFARLFS